MIDQGKAKGRAAETTATDSESEGESEVESEEGWGGGGGKWIKWRVVEWSRVNTPGGQWSRPEEC